MDTIDNEKIEECEKSICCRSRDFASYLSPFRSDFDIPRNENFQFTLVNSNCKGVQV